MLIIKKHNKYVAIALPLGNNLEGLPLSVQLMTKHFNEQELLNISQSFLNKIK